MSVGQRVERGANVLFEFLVGHQYLGRQRWPDHEQAHGQHAEGEAADVREERHASAGLRLDDREAALPELEAEPEAEEEERRHLEQQEEDERQHARAREEHEVGAEHAGDGAARAEGRNRSVGGRPRRRA